MFSTQEYEYIKDLTMNYYNKGYNYYLCYTNNPNNSYNQSYYDIFCYFSEKEITQNNNTFTINNNSKFCSIDTKSPTSTYKNNSLVCNNGGGNTTINQKEFIYSNVGNNVNIIQEYENNINFYKNIELYSTSILIVIILMFLYKFIRSVLGK